jgi:hypothetical protein
VTECVTRKGKSLNGRASVTESVNWKQRLKNWANLKVIILKFVFK